MEKIKIGAIKIMKMKLKRFFKNETSKFRKN